MSKSKDCIENIDVFSNPIQSLKEAFLQCKGLPLVKMAMVRVKV